MVHIVFGLTLLGVGIWGVVDQWYYLKDLLSGIVPILLVGFGVFAIWIAIMSDNSDNNHKKNDTD
ncbi:MAG: hypothetical protein HQM15_08420 [Deltaproteobacteria bacterium]|nr:hypothetical protein [Deltaproteobacteria bacterium]